LTNPATRLKQEGTNFQIALSPSGTAGNVVTPTYIVDFDNTNGNVRATNFVLSSAKELKSGVKQIQDLSRFDKVNIIEYKYISDLSKRTRYGVVAEDLETIAPEIVYGVGENKTVGYIDLLMAKIARLEERLKILEDKING
jgi:hypothetical protein